ncbi:MAG TPA: TonB-dependent receptor [Sphingobacteriaceae bacterium]|nr:TonB-dependent receptor [Sphingobacteriaceae bacterium]
MKLKVFNTIFYCLISTVTFAQYTLSGKVVSSTDGTALNNCEIYLNDNKSKIITNSRGEFVFRDLKNGTYTIMALYPGYHQMQQSIIIADKDATVVLSLLHNSNELAEVIVKDKKTDFGFRHLQAVENLAIYEGKKSEVIIPDQLVANLATNNARQIYSRVAGLNIYENDGAGLQLSIGGRGLDPNRSSNFNVRQNGYDISADALGYPESYYTPPVEAVGQIQIVRGAASLQYGTQFGGLINFVMKKPVADKKLELTARQSIGSYNFNNSFLSASGTVNKLSYYAFAQYKKGEGWRPNTKFENYNLYGNLNYRFTQKTTLGLDVTHMDYLAQQPGGLDDQMFKSNPQQSNRERNWFKVNWNLFALHLNHKINQSNEVNLRVFGLSAYRYSVGFRPNRVASPDDNNERDLIKGDFKNWGAEARYLKRYTIKNAPSVLLIGGRYYHGFNHSVQGQGSKEKDANFNFVNPDKFTANDYEFPNRNASFFFENIFRLSDKFSITPGLRYEYIHTKTDGFFSTISYDLAGNIISNGRNNETRDSKRGFVLAGLGISYKPTSHINLYGNLSQNYRSITFTDMRTANPSFTIDPKLTDEKGFSLDAGIRSEQTSFYSYDVSAFYLNYNNRIGEIQYYDVNNRVLRQRTNIGQAIIMGIETYAEADFLHLLSPDKENWSAVLFSNVAFIHSNYKASGIPGVKGKEVEFVPDLNMKTGLRLGYKNLKASLQYTHLSEQYTDASNATEGGLSGVIGIIPAYSVWDASLSYQFKKFRLEGNSNNMLNKIYYTRRATGYPGPGILPSDNRSFYITLQIKI